jgi:hypothetical protein
MSVETITPSGWKVDSPARRKRRFVGRNSRVMVALLAVSSPWHVARRRTR